MNRKKLYLLRHAKSSWKDFSIKDFDRPLNKRGKYNAPMMAERLAKMGEKPEIIISSPAKRAKSTAKYFAKALGSELIYDDSIYESTPHRIREIINDAFKKYDSVMIVGHNPTMTVLANSLCDCHIDNVPTSGIVAYEIEGGDMDSGAISMIFYDYPKKDHSKQ